MKNREFMEYLERKELEKGVEALEKKALEDKLMEMPELEDADPEKVNKYTRASKYDGKAIYCPKCNTLNRVYHFTWSAITCGGCKGMVDKTDWNLTK